ncbi:unnamed protein product [Mycena citricolor]|uniref:Transmembrane protein n=1 Tax=Mycena citricolor TaxID=2018698 RepID=A0AAD2Q1Y9_9AGAR|nr:unnamed protein product [Mycena citricolor]
MMRFASAPSALSSMWALLGMLSLILFPLVSAGSTNVTIDDSAATYLPASSAGKKSVWFNQTSCAGCADVPNTSAAFDQTWSAALYLSTLGTPVSASISFSGTAVYVYFIVPNFAAGSGLASSVDTVFLLDGVQVGSFAHQSDGSGNFAYNTLVYQNTSVPAGDHTLLMQTSGTQPAIMIFDYALSTKTTPDALTQSSPLPVTQASSTASQQEQRTQAVILSLSSVTTTTTTTADAQPSVLTTSSAELSTSSTSSSTSSLLQSSTSSVPAFSSAPLPSTSAPTAAPPPFLITTGSGTPSALPDAPSPSPSSGGSTFLQDHLSVLISAAIGGVVLLVFLLICILLYRRNVRRKRAGHFRDTHDFGTISSFDLIPEQKDGPPMRPRRSDDGDLEPINAEYMYTHSPSPSLSGRALPIPPTSLSSPSRQHLLHSPAPSTSSYSSSSLASPSRRPVLPPSAPSPVVGGRSVAATQTKPGESSIPSSSNSSPSAGPSNTSNPDLRIRIPAAASQLAIQNGTPCTATAYSPVTRNGATVPRKQAEYIRDVLAHPSRYSPADFPMSPDSVDDSPLGSTRTAVPVRHLDSGFRIGESMLDLPPEYAPT